MCKRIIKTYEKYITDYELSLDLDDKQLTKTDLCL